MGQKQLRCWPKLRQSPYVEISVTVICFLLLLHLWSTTSVVPLPPTTFSDVQHLPPNHSLVLEYIAKNHIYPPSLKPYNLLNSTWLVDPSQHRDYLNYTFGNKRNGFFLECGANNGEFFSNTLGLEKDLAWTGLLIEAHPELGKELLRRNRKAWFANLCLSPYNNITEINFEVHETQKYDWQIGGGKVQMSDDIEKVKTDSAGDLHFRTLSQVKCFPLDSVLKALNITHIDFFSFDVQGVELKILKTLPWDGSVTIDLIFVEYNLLPEGKDALRDFMKSKGYKVIWDNGNDFMLQRNGSSLPIPLVDQWFTIGASESPSELKPVSI